MGSSPKTTQTQNATTQMGPWAPSQGALTGILGAANGLVGQAGQTTPLQQQGLMNLGNNANAANQYAPQISGLTNNLFGGGGFGSGVPGIQTAMANAENNLTPYANGQNLDPTTNPAYQSLLQSINTQVNKNVGGQFAAAGREFSPAQAGAMSREETNALAPYLFNQYNQNVQNQFGANQALTGNALNASGAYDASAGNRLNAQLQAPGSIGNMNIPAYMQMGAGGAPLQTSVGNLGTLSNLLLPIAGLGTQGTSSGTATQQDTGGMGQQVAGGLLGAAGVAAKFLPLFMSDARIKENIREIGATHDGQKIYAFNYKGDPRTSIGLIAQEVAKKHPHAVFQSPEGVLFVDYRHATADAARIGETNGL